MGIVPSMKRLLLSLMASAAASEPLVLDTDTSLDPGRTYGALEIRASGITIDGKGAWIVGATDGDPKDYKGVGISAKGVSKVTLKNVKVKGFETGLRLEDGEGWTIERCDFSDNFHDPKFGWGENGRRGGIVLTRTMKTTVRDCRANRNWDACSLEECDGCVFEKNDFSKCSNTCMKLWTSCGNTFAGNNFSWGIRIDPGEVHARDSTSVLIESGSNRNVFRDNDCTHGGDGIFVRVLNGWCSTENLFEGNDCSYANNNAIECWSRGNTWIRNKANHSSYGFWMGGSDHNVLIDNEAAHNGDPKGNHNSPHLPDEGHAGIVFMFGPSSHTVLRGNRVHHNNGAGIAAIGHQESKGAAWKAFHWVVERNVIEENRWGIYLQHADWIDIGPNTFSRNSVADVHDAGGVTRLTRREGDGGKPPTALIVAPKSLRAGEEVLLDGRCSADPELASLRYAWDFGDGATSAEAAPKHAWAAPGFYRVGLTVTDGSLSALHWLDACVSEPVDELGTEGSASAWSFVCQTKNSQIAFADDPDAICGKTSLRATIRPYGGFRVAPVFPRTKDANWSMEGKKEIVFWVKAVNGDVAGWQDGNPVVTLHESEERAACFLPARDWFREPKHNEGRDGWNYYRIPLAGDAAFRRSGAADLKTVHWISIGVDSWGWPPLTVWIDGLSIR
jgi:parallel beta-helix repeat protein